MTGSNWREMFEQGRGGNGRGVDRNMGGNIPPAQQDGFAPTHAPAPQRDEPDDDGAPALDMNVYRPWTLQRGRGRPSMLLDLRRYEPKSGLWIGWQMAYPHLIAVEYIGDKMLSLDFGTRQFMIEGRGLDELARHLQQGSVVNVVEYSERVWGERRDEGVITSITRIGREC
jgi:hypothetical protein